ncbi:MAG: hypothetical protein P4L51_10495 [Puia sp.]|nr:hypothetical protein [Puia sp.]
MKKWGLLLLVILVLAWVGICLWIPGKLHLSVAMDAGCSETGAFRRLTEETCWEKWWPQGKLMNQPYCGPDRHPFVYESYSYRLTGIDPRGIEVAIQQGDFSFDTRIAIVSRRSPDTISLEWGGNLTGSSLNPFERIRQYRRVEAIRRGMTGILSNLCSYLGKRENIYGFEIRELRPSDSSWFPKNLFYENLLMGSVRGGSWTVSRAIDQLHLFISDYHREAAAAPFEYLVTDRTKEPDTAKWVTRVYCAVTK